METTVEAADINVLGRLINLNLECINHCERVADLGSPELRARASGWLARRHLQMMETLAEQHANRGGRPPGHAQLARAAFCRLWSDWAPEVAVAALKDVLRRMERFCRRASKRSDLSSDVSS